MMAELLAPAGNIEALDAAIGEGADAVYMGLKSFNARLRSSNFAWNQFEAAVEAVHRQKKKIYVTVNTVIEESETERLYRFLSYLNKVGPDALIVQDFGIVRMVQEFFPKLELHASTQMNIASAAAVNLLSKEGIKRVVLARELNLEEISSIKRSTSSELEVFVHGALCVSESGLCLFSSFLGGKSANRGMCTQACRRYYEAELPGGAKEKGYYFSPHDLQLIDRLPALIKAGVDSFKIEGRMKSAEYVGSVTAAYRYVLDNWEKDEKGAVETGKRMLSTDFARAKTRYWFDGSDASKFLNPNQAGGTGIYLGKIESLRSEKSSRTENSAAASPADGSTDSVQKFALLKGGSYEPEAGDSIRIHKKDDSGRISYKVQEVQNTPSSHGTAETWISVPPEAGRGDPVYLLQTKSMSKRYKRVLPADLSPYRLQPSDERLPILDLTPLKKDSLSFFPEGVYIQVSTLSDMHACLAEHPVRFILELNSDTRRSLIAKKEALPCSKKQVFISLDPFCTPETQAALESDLKALREAGFYQWIVNNPAHINMLKSEKDIMIGGPYLYTFNRWAVSWLENQNIDAFIMSHESSRSTLESIFEGPQRSRLMICLFAYPALFRMRFKLPDSYDFSMFNDREGMSFRALSTPDGSFVMPADPFSIIDRVHILKKQGFSRFLIDMSKTGVRRGDIKAIMRALHKGEALPGTERFNWKDGFYSPTQNREELRPAQRKTEKSSAPFKQSKSSSKPHPAKKTLSGKGARTKGR
ncbi:peptidase U32 family protein [Treponema sp. HNW]|uniref:peptidase U32 family protein n=1 Tax=Treponema sp. HNW TaxID=3116654 RepID=UPI003D137FA5